MQGEIESEPVFNLKLTREEMDEVIRWYHEGHDETKPSHLADQLKTLRTRANESVKYTAMSGDEAREFERKLAAGEVMSQPVQIVTSDPTQASKIERDGAENPQMPASMQWIERDQ